MADDLQKISPEKRLFQSIVEETVDDIYVINKENYNLLYTNELKNGFLQEESRVGKKCYQILHGKSEPCEFCTLKKRDAFDIHQEVTYEDNGRFFSARFREMDWEGTPACVKFVRDARVYADYHDITAEKKMQEQLRQQYIEQIHQHYLMAGPDALILGHCNITKNKICEIVDHTDSGLLEMFGDVREEFFIGIGTLIVDEEERREFYSKYLNEPSQRAFDEGIKEIVMPCFIQLPNQKAGKYVQFKVTLVETPDTGDATGVLTITDITEKTIQHQ